MYHNKRLKKWSPFYWNQIKRNIGLLTFLEQEKLRKSFIAIFGVGGLGGPLVEQLARVGCEKIVICDNEKFDASNLNRQLCTTEDIGKYKVDIIEELLKKINPQIFVKKFYEINENNISLILKNSSVASLTLDDPISSIIISRECLKDEIPMIESWGIPYLFAWWFTSDSLDYESCYGLKTKEKKISEIRKSKKILSEIRRTLLNKVLQFPEIKETYNRVPGTVEGMVNGTLPLVSLSPIVRITASYIAFEIIYSCILEIKPMNLAPKVLGYDYFRMKPIDFNFE